MEKNEIANIKEMSNEQIMQAIGQDDGSSIGVNIPRLAINRSPEDDDGNKLPAGHFYVYDSAVGQNVFGKPITLRPFLSAMQYMHYDAEKGEYTNRSIIFKSWKEEAIDMLGGTKCGKLSFKERSTLNQEEFEKQRTIRCYKLVYGLLSFKDGVTAKGNAHTLENLPVLYRVTGTAFSPVSVALNELRERKKFMFNCTFSLVNADTNLQLSDTDRETLNRFQESINDENKIVIDAYNSAKKKLVNNNDKSDLKVVEELSPEQVLSK